MRYRVIGLVALNAVLVNAAAATSEHFGFWPSFGSIMLQCALFGWLVGDWAVMKERLALRRSMEKK